MTRQKRRSKYSDALRQRVREMLRTMNEREVRGVLQREGYNPLPSVGWLSGQKKAARAAAPARPADSGPGPRSSGPGRAEVAEPAPLSSSPGAVAPVPDGAAPELGQLAYESYSGIAGLPWGDLPEAERARWQHVAAMVDERVRAEGCPRCSGPDADPVEVLRQQAAQLQELARKAGDAGAMSAAGSLARAMNNTLATLQRFAPAAPPDLDSDPDFKKAAEQARTLLQKTLTAALEERQQRDRMAEEEAAKCPP